MIKKQGVRKEWEKVISESIKNKPNIEGIYPPEVIRNRELLLLGQLLLGKIEAGINVKFHAEIYKTIMKHYFQQKRCLKI